MKLFLNLICLIAAIYALCFPFIYGNSSFNKKEIKISHILVDTQNQAEALKQDILDKKITFEEAAVKYSKCPSGEDKGDLGYNMRGKLKKDFETAAFSQKIHTLSNPVKTEDGWHIIKVSDIKYFSDKDSFGKRY